MTQTGYLPKIYRRFNPLITPEVEQLNSSNNYVHRTHSMSTWLCRYIASETDPICVQLIESEPGRVNIFIARIYADIAKNIGVVEDDLGDIPIDAGFGLSFDLGLVYCDDGVQVTESDGSMLERWWTRP